MSSFSSSSLSPGAYVIVLAPSAILVCIALSAILHL